ncbi:hypothetical protein KAR91_01840 [Candidatus Pacearchaeota archaeon]|nr:hypothetical protein [Candidatus Pacearchaeota archaeon]
MRKRLRKKLHKGYSWSVAELRDPLTGDSLRKAAKKRLISEAEKSIAAIDGFKVKTAQIGKTWGIKAEKLYA